jgi:hypothetical protein
MADRAGTVVTTTAAMIVAVVALHVRRRSRRRLARGLHLPIIAKTAGVDTTVEVVVAAAAMTTAGAFAAMTTAGAVMTTVKVAAAAGMAVAGEAVTTADMVLRSLPCFLSSCLVLYAAPHPSVRAGADRRRDRPRDEPYRRMEPPRLR